MFISLYFDVLNNENYLVYLKYLIDNHSISIENKNSNIIIAKIKDACIFADLDIVIIPSFVDNYWPLKPELQGLLNDSMKTKLGIPIIDKEQSLRIILNLINRKKGKA